MIRYASGPASVRASQVPPRVLRDLIGMVMGIELSPRRHDDLCAWADRFGGDVVVEFDPDDPLTPRSPDGYTASQLRFVSSR